MEKINLTFISNSSTEVFDDNTLTRFKNKLPLAISLTDQERWVFTVKSFGIHLNYGTIKIPRNVPIMLLLDLKAFHSYQLKHDAKSPNDLLKNFIDDEIGVRDKLYINPKDYKIFEIYKILDDFLMQSSFGSNLNLKVLLSQNNNNTQLKFTCNLHTVVLFMHSFMNESLQFFSSDTSEKLLQKIDTNGKVTALSGSFRDGEHEHLLHTFTKTDASLTSKQLKEFSLKAPKFIKIKCGLIKKVQSNLGFDNVVYHTSIPIQTFNGREYFFKEIKVPLQCELLSEQLNVVEFTITDESGEQLHIAYGVPTIISCVLEKKMLSSKHFYVQVYSKCTDLYKDNTASTFSVQLSPPLQFPTSKAQVALVSATLPSKIANVPNIGNRSFAFIYHTKANNVWSKNETLPLPSGYFESALDYINALNECIPEKFAQFSLKNGYAFIKHNQKCGISLPRFVLKILGRKFEFGDADDHLDPEYFTIYNEGRFEIYLGRVNIDLYLPRYALCYCSIIQPSIVGSYYSPVLRILPLKKSTNDFISYEFDNLEFCPLNSNYIPSASFELRTHSGDKINLSEDQLQEPVLLTLCFKTE